MKRAANDTEARLIHIKQLLKLLTGQTAELHRLAALKTLEMRGLYGLNKFDQNGQSYCNIIVTQVKDGKYGIVAMTPSAKMWEMSAAK